MDRRFIELTMSDGRSTWINVDHIVNIFDSNGDLTGVNLDDRNTAMYVREAAHHILNLINGEPNGETL